MKLIIRLLLVFIVCFSVLSINLKSNSELTSESKSKEDFTPQWTNLFVTLIRPPQLCDIPENLRKDDDNDDSNSNDGIDNLVPYPKKNRFAKQQGFGPSAYLFDFFDDVLQKDILAQFMQMFNAAKAIPPVDPTIYKDP